MSNNLYIFDFDGTLADTKSIVKMGLVEYSKENNLPVPDVDLICYGYANPDLYDFKYGVGKKEQKELMDRAFIQISNRISNMQYVPELFENVKDVIKELYERGHTLTICTSREKEAVERILEHYGLRQYFSILKTRDDVKLRNKQPKPSPDLLLEIIEELEFENKLFSKNNIFMVGDTDADIYAGKNASIKTIGVSYGYFSKDEISKCNPDYMFDNLKEILIGQTI